MLPDLAAQLLRLISAPMVVVWGSGEIAGANPAFCRLLGETRDKLLGCHLTELATDPAEKTSRLLKLFAGSGDWVVGGLSLRRADGDAVDFPCKGLTLQRSSANSPALLGIQMEMNIQFGVLNRTVTELNQEILRRRRLETDLRLTQFTVDKSADPIYWIRPDGGFQYVNDAACRALGYTPEELLRIRMSDIDVQFSSRDWSEYWQTLKKQGSYTFETLHRATDGRLIPVEVTANFIEFGGQEYKCAFVRDITERKRAAQELEELNATLEHRVREEVASNREKDLLLIHQSRLAAMGEMVHNIAHQWRQPLNALAIIINNIKDDYEFGELTAERLDETVNKSRQLLERMSATVEDFRDFFRPDKVASDFPLDGSVEDAVFIIGDSLKNNNIELIREMKTGLIGHGYHNQFAQSMLNLLANAKEAILQRKVAAGRILIHLWQEGNEGVLTVQDNAGGIDETALPKIFDPYYTTKDQGSGIGLYMTRMIVERNMNGRINVANRDGGAVFTIRIPLVKENAG